MSGVAESQVAGEGLGDSRAARVLRGNSLTGVTLVIALTTALALALRVYYQSTRAGFLLGVTEYDDGPYFGSALRLAAGVLPYRDFFIVQPPGITLLLAPVALVARVTGTASGMEMARVITIVASGAGIVLAGLLVRRSGTLAVLITCGIMAVHPESIAAAHTVLVEPWLVVFCLIGALALFDGDRLAQGWRLAWAGVAFGFGGAVEAWAIVPVLVAILLFLPKIKRAVPFCAGVAAGFLIPVLPFFALAPRQFYEGVIVAQLQRVRPARAPVWARFANILGIANPSPGQETAVFVIAIVVAVVVAGMIVAASLISHRPPPLLERFVVLTSAFVIVMFALADQFYYHFVAFLVPFLAASIALPLCRLLAALSAPDSPRAHQPQDSLGEHQLQNSPQADQPQDSLRAHQPQDSLRAHQAQDSLQADQPQDPQRQDRRPQHAQPQRRQPQHRQPRPHRVLWLVATGLAVVAIIFVAVTQFRAESVRADVIGPAPRSIDYIIPPGACVLTDQASMTILANRFYSDVSGCPQMVDGLATDLALSQGRKPSEGAGYVPAVAAVWQHAFSHAQIVLLSPNNIGRIAWTPQLKAYFGANFVPLRSPWKRVTLYKRKGFNLRKARAASKHQ